MNCLALNKRKVSCAILKNLARHPVQVWSNVIYIQTLISPIIYWSSFSWKLSSTSIYSTLWHVMKFKPTLGIPQNKWSWLVASSTWSYGFVWKLFLVSKLHSGHMIKVTKSSIASFCEGLSLVQVLVLYYI